MKLTKNSQQRSQLFFMLFVVVSHLVSACGEPFCEQLDLPMCDFIPGISSDSAKFVMHSDLPRKLFTVNDERYPFVGINRFNVYDASSNGGGLSTEAYLDRLRQAGITIVRIFVPTDIENTIGVYDEGALAKIDRVLDAAWERRLGIIFALFDHYPMLMSWQDTAYSRYGSESTSLYRQPDALKAAKKRIEFLVKRYHEHPAIAAWEPINELNGIHQDYFDPNEFLMTEALQWFDSMAITIRTYDINNHLITQSLICDCSWPRLWQHQELDMIQLHLFPGWLSYNEMQRLIEDIVDDHWKYNKPVFIGEIGIRPEDCSVPALRSAVEIAAKLDSAALVWTHVRDPYFDLVHGSDPNSDLLNMVYGGSRCAIPQD